jgi:hypothetical protein
VGRAAGVEGNPGGLLNEAMQFRKHDKATQSVGAAYDLIKEAKKIF